MGKINVLDFEIANLIAAGEVVERPSSVMKELIENSIDSGADTIIAEIKHGGVALIRVSDNGCGIEKEDLPVALKRHATSKIKDREDLDAIMTLGFRGEALAAISSVSNVTIISKTKNASIATMLTSEGGRVTDISEVGAADGTTVVVEDLFFNVPARRKFLKKDATEAMNVSALVEKVALSRPDISIQLLVDGQERFKTPGDGQLINAIYAVFGKDFSNKLIEADGKANGITVHGYIGRSDNVRKNRNLENVFINGRYVKSLTAMAAIEKAYTSYIAPEAFPTCVLFIEMNPSTVDVNVHPAKLEVKFSSEQQVFEAIYYTVKNAIETYTYRPEMEFQKPKASNPLNSFVPIDTDTKGEQISLHQAKVPPLIKPSVSKLDVDLDKPLSMSSTYSSPRNEQRKYNSMSPTDSISLLNSYKQTEPQKIDIDAFRKNIAIKIEEKRAEPIEKKSEIPEYRFIGEAFDCYVMIEYDGAMLVIDKHAAHERVIFEDLKKQNESDGRVASQALLIPITVELSPEELSVIVDYSSDIDALGFDFKINGDVAEILAIPDAIGSADAETLFAKIADELVRGNGNPLTTDAIRREKALYQIACKAAIKGGRKYDRSILDWLIGKILSMPDIIVCPHGRPIAYRLTKNELDKQFSRIK